MLEWRHFSSLDRLQGHVRIERGKEYLPVEKTVQIGNQPVKLKLALKRWSDMAAAGWYSGDTHVHRSMDDLPNLLMAEDLNVGLPLTYWVTAAYLPPSSEKGKAAPPLKPDLIRVDPTHVIYPPT